MSEILNFLFEQYSQSQTIDVILEITAVVFGLLSVLGSYYLLDHQMVLDLLLPASTIGFLSMAVLNLNNMRDIENDAKNNKNTLVVSLGSSKAKIYHYVLICLAVLLTLLYSIK